MYNKLDDLKPRPAPRGWELMLWIVDLPSFLVFIPVDQPVHQIVQGGVNLYTINAVAVTWSDDLDKWNSIAYIELMAHVHYMVTNLALQFSPRISLLAIMDFKH